MTDVFISYRRDDRDRCADIAGALQDAGFDVWFDAKIEPGTSFDREIERAIRETKAVLVLWSSGSIESDWVRNEARIGKRADKLIAARIDDCEPPLEFSSVQTIDLFAASPDERQAAWDRIISRVAHLVERPPVAIAPLSHGGRAAADRPLAARRWLPWAGGVVAAGALGVALLSWNMGADPAAAGADGTETVAAPPGPAAVSAEAAPLENAAAPGERQADTPPATAPIVPDKVTSTAPSVPAPTTRSDSMSLSCNAGPFIIFYDYEKASLTPEAKSVLEQVVLSYFSACNGARIHVSVYADSSLNAVDAMDYTRRKAASVARYLTSQDIPGDMIRTEAFGKGVPRVATADGVREVQNRRVEITFGPS